MRDVNYEFADLERKLNSAVQSLGGRVADIDTRLDSLDTRTRNNNQVSYAEILNLLNNSVPEWSKSAYTTLGVSPSDVTDANREAYNWFRQLVSDTDLNNTSSEALKAEGHSAFLGAEGANADIPRWDIVNGFIEIGGASENWDVSYLLPNNLIFPGLRLYVQFEAQLRTSDPMPNVQFFAGFWDDTAGEQKFIEGGNFTVTGEIYGDQSGTESVDYVVIASTDSGEQAKSNTLSFTNAPSVFTQNNHPRIFLDGAPGFIKFEIYRFKDGAYSSQGVVLNSIDNSFFDVRNEPVRTVSAFPSITQTAPRAYAVTRVFQPGSLVSGAFVRHELTIKVPTTYDTTATDPDSQWLRLGLTGLTDVARQLRIRRIGLSLGHGNWSRSPEDNREGVHSRPSTTATNSPDGNTGTGEPFPSGSGGCVPMNTPIEVVKKGGEPFVIPLGELKTRCRAETIFCESDSVILGKVADVKTGFVSSLLHIECEGASIPCSREQRFITDKFDTPGTPAANLKIGDYVSHKGKKIKIIDIREEFGSFQVGIPLLDGAHAFRADGFDLHNAKNAPI